MSLTCYGYTIAHEMRVKEESNFTKLCCKELSALLNPTLSPTRLERVLFPRKRNVLPLHKGLLLTTGLEPVLAGSKPAALPLGHVSPRIMTGFEPTRAYTHAYSKGATSPGEALSI